MNLRFAIAICAPGLLLAQPARIVSTSPSITETLFALGAGGHVVGVSTYCRYPPKVLDLPKVGTYSKPSAELIAQLRPDLVFLNKAQGEIANRLAALGIRTVEIQQGSLADLFTSIRRIGDETGRRREAGELVGRIQSRMASARARQVESPSPPSALIVVAKDRERLTGMVAAGTKTYLGELLEAAGARNALTGAAVATYPRISLEAVIHLNPDFLIDASGMGDEPNDTPEQRRRTIAPWLERTELKAVKSGHVTAILSEALVVPGPRVLDALDLIEQCLDRARRSR